MTRPKENFIMENPITEDCPELTGVDKVQPYLQRFFGLKFSKKRIKWVGSKQDFADLDEVLENISMDRLKRMILGGAPYLYKQNENNYAFAHCAFYSRSDILDVILERHKHEKTPKDEAEFLSQASEALQIVCQTNCGEFARMLLQAGIPIDETLHPHEAAKYGSWVVLEEMYAINPNVHIDRSDVDGKTPLHHATERGFTYTIKYLLDKTADPNQTNAEGSTALHLACQHADEDAVYLLTLRGARVNATDVNGKTPALIAGENGKYGVIHILAGAGADLDRRDNRGNLPLISASKNGHASTVRELILNGASLEVSDNDRYNSLEQAILNRKDGAAAMYVRLERHEDYLSYYFKTIEIHLFKLVSYNMVETLDALLDRMVIQPDTSRPNTGLVLTKYLEIDNENKTPADDGYKSNRTFFLQRLSELENEKIAYHGTVRLLVDRKMAKFGYWILAARACNFLLFLLSLAYSLVQASYATRPRDTYLLGPLDYIRIATDAFVVFFVLTNIFTESVEFFRIVRLTYSHLQDKQQERIRMEKREDTLMRTVSDFIDPEDFFDISSLSEEDRAARSLSSRLNDILCVRIFTDYFTDKFNILDLLGLVSLLFLIALRATRQPVQWIFATLAFLINSLRIYKFIVLIPNLGPYATTIYKILVKDVPLFSSLFLITLLMFTGSYYISLRTPYTSEGFLNQSLSQDTARTPGIDNSVEWVFISGLRVLLEGNIYDGEYLYKHLNWLAAVLYEGFLFMTVVVLLNVFIAQLSDTYGTVKRNAERTYAWQRLNFIVQVQRTSLLSLCVDFRKLFYIESIPIDKYTLYKYYGVHRIGDLNVKNFTEEIDIKSMLSTIQSQQIVARKTQEILRYKAPLPTIIPAPAPPSHIPSRGRPADIQELNSRVNQILQLLSEKESQMEQRMEQRTNRMLRQIEQRLSRLLDEKLSQLK